MNIKNFFIIIFLAIFFLSTSCGKKKQPPPKPIYPVKIVSVIKKDSPIFIDNIGHVIPIITVEIKSRVEGELMEVHFEQGKEVKEGDPLLTIDSRPFEADLEKAKGGLEESIAELYIAKDSFVRNKDLIKDDYISQLDFDQLASDVSKMEGIVKQRQAEVEYSQLNIEYCHIYAPISGKTGILQIDKGNMIYPQTSNPILILNQMAPIYVQFFAPEKELPRILKFSKEATLNVRVAFDDLDKDYIEGKLDMIDNEVDTNTGLIKLRGIFDNDDRMLWPGKFVKTRLILKIQKDALTIPYQTVQLTTSGPIVFVVKEDSTVEMRHVELGQREGDQIIINKGVNENEKVVTQGQLNLSDGARVTTQPEETK